MKNNQFRRLTFFALFALSFAQIGWSQTKLISVHVIDKKLQKPAAEVDIWANDAKGTDVFRGKTNARGDLDFQSDIKSGRDIEIRATKNGTYIEQTKVHRVGDDATKNKVAPFEMATSAGNRTTIRVFNPKTTKPVEAAIIRYKNHVGELERVTTNLYGEVSFPIYFPDGMVIEFTVEKPGYAELPVTIIETLKIGGSVFLFELSRQHKFSKCNYFLIGAGAAGVASGILELSSRSAYNDSKPFSNTSRESDLSASTSRRQAAIIIIGAGILSAIAWKLCKNKEKRDKKAALKRNRHGSIDGERIPDTNSGLAYQPITTQPEKQ
jgi:hypothetical protein